MFGEVIREVLVCEGPVHMVLLLVDAISDPIEMHVNGTGSALGDGVIGEANGSGVINLNGCWGLWVSEFFKGGGERGRFFGVVEEGTEFGFGSGGKDHFHYGG